MSECIFCQIAAGEAPASVVYEDQYVIVFMDLFPWNLGHALVIPKQHAVHIQELPETLRSHLFEVATALVLAQKAAGIPCDGNNILINDGPAANQSVPHVHIHSVPRKQGDLMTTALHFVTRLRNHFGQAAVRKRLDAQAAEIAAHMPKVVDSVLTRAES